MFCPRCGAQNLDTSTFCKDCGAPLGGANQAPMGAVGGAPVGGGMPVGGAQAAVMSSMALVKNNKNLPKIIIGVVALIAVIAIVFGIVSCALGGGLKPGVYSIQSGGSTQSFVVNNDNTISFSSGGYQCVATYSKAGEQGNSTIYDLNIKSLDGVEVEYDENGYIIPINTSGSSSPTGLKYAMQIMVPKGCNDGNYAGDWGARVYWEYKYLTSVSSQYSSEMMRLDENGSAQGYMKSDYASYSLEGQVPEMTPESLVMQQGDTGPYNMTWHAISDNSFSLFNSSGSSAIATFVFPAK